MLNTSYLSVEKIYDIICQQLEDIDKQGLNNKHSNKIHWNILMAETLSPIKKFEDRLMRITSDQTIHLKSKLG